MKTEEKLVIIINGTGGVGKDTLCSMAAGHYRVRSISSITPIKRIAERYGWNEEKDARSRKFLSDLKKAFTDYNDLPTRYLCEQYEQFRLSEEEILFVQIREKTEIEKFKKLVDIRCMTLLIVRNEVPVKWGNLSDDQVLDYEYDCCFENNRCLEETEKEFIAFLQELINGP